MPQSLAISEPYPAALTCQLMVTCAAGLEDLLARELRELGEPHPRIHHGWVGFAPQKEQLMRPMRVALAACLFSRIANRVLLVVGQFPCTTADELRCGTRDVGWEEHLDKAKTFAVRCGKGEGELAHSHFAALCVKDGIVDRMRDRAGQRPTVDAVDPHLIIDLRLRQGVATLSLDLSGGSLHRRHQRVHGGDAPLKETLAAAILMRSGLHGAQHDPTPLVDPMCGSATLLLEAAGMLADHAPGLDRARFGIDHWTAMDLKPWQELRHEALERSKAGRHNLANWHAVGLDNDPRQLGAALQNVAHAGLADVIKLKRADAAELCDHLGPRAGKIVTNAPFGHRLGGHNSELEKLYGRLGKVLRPLAGWTAHVLIGDEPELGHALGLRAHKKHALQHGPLACTLLHFELGQPEPKLSAGAQAVANRLSKNVRRLRGIIAAQGAWRAYDADLPEYAAAIDVYTDESQIRHAVVQEYAPPKQLDSKTCQRRLRELCRAATGALEVSPENLVLKVRRRQRADGGRYTDQEASLPLARHGSFVPPQGMWVQEGSLRFWVELTTTVDTGLFLDHRPLRAWLVRHAAGQDVLNLFAYTGSLSVAAGAGGAKRVLTVDLSRTYLRWAERNLRGNGASPAAHQLERTDCLAYLAASHVDAEHFDLVLLNPPTFSNSKRMENDFDLVRDHEQLIRQAMARVRPTGMLFFSTHARRLRLAEALCRDFQVEEASHLVKPADFERPHGGCRAYLVRHRPLSGNATVPA